MSTATPWAILLTKWNDHGDEPHNRAFYENLFTTAGTGTFNMTDYFDTMSHGNLDLSGSQIFGWNTLAEKQADYNGNAPHVAGKVNRYDLFNIAKAKASAAGVPLSNFFGVVVVMNTLTDLFGLQGGQVAVCDPGSFEPSVLGQEMGHGYSLAHSRVDGSTNDYQDPWDTMSTWDGCFMAGDPNYTLIGPGLNAANMRLMGWLDETRVWKATTPAFTQELELRPLHRRDLPGHLALELPGTAGGYLVEFRVSEDWDSAIPRAAVFVHRYSDGHSYRMLGTSANSDLIVGEKFTSGVPNSVFTSFTSLEVLEINEQRHFARVRVTYHPRQILHVPSIVGEIFGGVAVDGGGVIIINGVLHPVDPWGPLVGIVNQVAAHSAADLIADPLVRLSAKKSALQSILRVASAALDDLTELETPPAQIERGGGKRAE